MRRAGRDSPHNRCYRSRSHSRSYIRTHRIGTRRPRMVSCSQPAPVRSTPRGVSLRPATWRHRRDRPWKPHCRARCHGRRPRGHHQDDDLRSHAGPIRPGQGMGCRVGAPGHSTKHSARRFGSRLPESAGRGRGCRCRQMSVGHPVSWPRWTPRAKLSKRSDEYKPARWTPCGGGDRTSRGGEHQAAAGVHAEVQATQARPAFSARGRAA